MSLRKRPQLGPRMLVVTAVEVERTAVLRGLGLHDIPPAQAITAGSHIVVRAAGVGPAAAAAATAADLAAGRTSEAFGLVISAGIAGGFADRAPVGSTVLGTRSVAADLGAESPDGFLSVADLGFGAAALAVDSDALADLRRMLPDALVGEVLSVSTVTGTAERARTLHSRHPDALAEAMEGFGVATAANQAGVAFAEIRTISNPIGPRDRAAWRIGDALAALSAAVGALASLVP